MFAPGLSDTTWFEITAQAGPIVLALVGWGRAYTDRRARRRAEGHTHRLMSALTTDPDIPVEKVQEIQSAAGLDRRATDTLNNGQANDGTQPGNRTAD